MINPLNHHYSMENPASVYDEEALTALQLAARTTGKVNEVVKVVNDYIAGLPAEIQKEVAEKVLEHIQSGKFDNQIEAYKMELEAAIHNLKTRVDNMVTDAGNSNSEVVDLRVGADRTQYDTAGEAVRAQFHILAEATENPGVVRVAGDQVVTGEYYHNDTGTITKDTSGVFSRSLHLYPSKPGQLYTLTSSNGLNDTHKLYLPCYGVDMRFLGYVHPFGGNIKTLLVEPTPPGTAYIGVSVGAHFSGEIELVEVEDVQTQGIAYPFDRSGKDYIFKENTYINGNGIVSYDYNTYDVCVFKTKGVKYIYTNSTILYNAIFINAQGDVISNGSKYNVHGLGRGYPVPDGAVLVAINMPKSGVDENGNTTSYIALTMEKSSNPLNGKSIVCIGDSITWLDGRSVPEANTTQMIGWQTELRKRGAIVHTLGYSGASYGTRTEDGTKVPTLYERLNNQGTITYPAGTITEDDGYNSIFDVDAVVLMCGSNDVAFETPNASQMLQYKVKMMLSPVEAYGGIEAFIAGAPQDNWHSVVSNPLYDDNKTAIDTTGYFETGIFNVIQWVGDNYPNAIIYICTPLRREGQSGGDVREYWYALRAASHDYATPLIDLYHDFGYSWDMFDRLFYDTTHPNREGMKRLGSLVARNMERSI